MTIRRLRGRSRLRLLRLCVRAPRMRIASITDDTGARRTIRYYTRLEGPDASPSAVFFPPGPRFHAHVGDRAPGRVFARFALRPADAGVVRHPAGVRGARAH